MLQNQIMQCILAQNGSSTLERVINGVNVWLNNQAKTDEVQKVLQSCIADIVTNFADSKLPDDVLQAASSLLVAAMRGGEAVAAGMPGPNPRPTSPGLRD